MSLMIKTMQEMIMTLHKIIFFTLYKNFIRFKNATSIIDRNEKGNLISLTIICNFTFLINIINLFTLEIKKKKNMPDKFRQNDFTSL